MNRIATKAWSRPGHMNRIAIKAWSRPGDRMATKTLGLKSAPGSSGAELELRESCAKLREAVLLRPAYPQRVGECFPFASQSSACYRYRYRYRCRCASLVQPHILSFQFGLNLSNIQLIEAALLLDSDRRRHTSALPGNGATHHVAGRRMADAIPTSDPTGAD